MRNPSTATKSSPCSQQLEKARMQQQRPNAAKKKKKKNMYTNGKQGQGHSRHWEDMEFKIEGLYL